MQTAILFLILAVALFVADRAFGFGFILSALGLISLGVAIAAALGIDLDTQQPFIEVIAPLVLLPVVIRAFFVLRFGSPETDRPQTTASEPKPESMPGVSPRDRNLSPLLKKLPVASWFLSTFTFQFVLATLAILLWIAVTSKAPPDQVVLGGIPAAAAYLVGSFASHRTESPVWTGVWAGVGLLLGGLLLMAALLVRLHWQ